MREERIPDEAEEMERLRKAFNIPRDARMVSRSGDDGDGTEFLLFEHGQKYCLVAHYVGGDPSFLYDSGKQGYWDQWDSLGDKDPKECPMWFNGSGKLLWAMFGDSLKDSDYEYDWGGTYLEFAFKVKDMLT